MSKVGKSKKELEAECERLRERLEEAEQTLRAIHDGEVDAVLVNTREGGEQIFTLESAERPYRLLVEEMQEGALTISVDGTILYCNRYFAELLRRPRERVIFCSLFHFVEPPERPRLHALVRKGATEIAQGEFAAITDDGTRVPVFIASNPLPTSDLPSICLVVTDLSMRKEQERLSAAKEASEEANRQKDQFLAALSHELRTPLTPVLLASTDLINRHDVPPQVRTELEMIRRNIELEARLIDDLLDLTRISRGKMQLSMQETDAHAMLHSALAICRSDIEAKQQQVSLQFEARRCHVKGDPARLHQVYWNLIKNAVKFTPPGGRSRSVRTATRGRASSSRSPTAGSGSSRRTCRSCSTRSSRGTRRSRAASAGSGWGWRYPRCSSIFRAGR
jgi:PAS domain S-box-containing protein